MQMPRPNTQTIRRLVRDERAATAVEYAMIAAGIAGVIVGAVTTLGTTVTGFYESVQAAFK